uniref:Uncharacterized protein n=1 Tax=Branchiostoma floridae TaxID=7739 RepID=C3ZYX3_BRAFL|eukprot:XP_002586233.1 hypothetical protein BRAFLDRAFT_132372 [Branchiostoma floridae]
MSAIVCSQKRVYRKCEKERKGTKRNEKERKGTKRNEKERKGTKSNEKDRKGEKERKGTKYEANSNKIDGNIRKSFSFVVNEREDMSPVSENHVVGPVERSCHARGAAVY